MKKDVVIVAAKRSAIGSFLGSLSKTPAHNIGKEIIRSILQETEIDPNQISETIIGQVLTTSQGQNPARQASISAGIPNSVPALTINQVCGSGLRSVSLAISEISNDNSDIILAGGQENMSLSPHSIYMRSGTKMGNGNLLDTMVNDGLTDAFNNYHMGVTAENIAKKFYISRQEQDEFAVNSQNKAERAQKQNKFHNEITPITIKNKKEEIIFKVDEFPRHGTTEESLAKLRPAFDRDGTVTAGNASGINDGAAITMLMTEKKARELKLQPIAYIKSFSNIGVSPELMGTGPIPSSKMALKKAGWNVSDLDVIEANEAFAAQAIAVNKEMGWDLEKVNINGGAIALGHPIGASGARILVSLIHEMKRQKEKTGKSKKGIATLCVGGGMGVAICLEN